MNGSAPLPATRHERETTATGTCVRGDDEGAGLLARAVAHRPPNEDRLRGLA